MPVKKPKDLIIVCREFPLSIKPVENSVYDSDDLIDIHDIVKGLCKMIMIDKSYVEYRGNKHKDGFLTTTGWNNLRKLLAKTEYGKKGNAKELATIDSAVSCMFVYYVYSVLDFNYGYDISQIILFQPPGSRYNVEYYEDTIKEWEHYDSFMAKLGRQTK